MKLFNSDEISNLWTEIMDLLDEEVGNGAKIKEVQKRLCENFDFEFSFIYRQNHEMNFIQDRIYYVDSSDKGLPYLVPAFGELQESYLLRGRLLYIQEGRKHSDEENGFLEIFGTNTLVLFPIIGDNQQMIGILGMGDRRKERRTAELDKSMLYSVFVLIANYFRLKENLTKIESTQLALQSIVDNMGVDIYVNDFFTHEILFVNKSMAKPYGGVKAITGEKCYRALYDDKVEECEYCPQKKLVDDNGKPTKIYSWDYRRPFDGTWFRVLSAAFRWVDQRVAHIVSSIDITDSKKVEESLRQVADYDQLTQIPNKRKLNADLEKLKSENGTSYFIMFLDINKFKSINDEHGHRVGDMVLSITADFISKNLAKGQTCYRFGGDEFVILCKGSSKLQAIKTAKTIEKRGREPLATGELCLDCSFSIGIASPEDKEDTPEEVLKWADMAMYKSKEKKDGGISLYNQGNVTNIEWYFNFLA
ncbi:diguanylate cyclase (GGDEF)-like protein [Aequitasia blattaphilus]|uniref:GGDEF domain-containing protein n=1 Tax=Aequitasia blattaphilus TaxID=2949332 RepID=A0ABT1EB76_9FIRM|nr:GGDEF domain-containing protein [Aequitasia blattaphilus]MCP1102879.1 GGDEF domain-containing protein [Aequitasia blattaphilus]MCR8615519.1 GGDEF domain-containing protein [Aequitasia blattaphilus]